MLLKARQLIFLAFVSLVTSKCQRLSLLRKRFEYFHVNISVVTHSDLNVVIYSSNHLSFVFYSFKFFVTLICLFFKLWFNLISNLLDFWSGRFGFS